MALTRAQIKSRAQALLLEALGTPQSGDPIAWDYLIDEAADELARATDCLYAAFAGDLTNGVSDYVCGPVYRVNAVSIYDSTGTIHLTYPYTPRDFDRQFGDTWRSGAPDQGQPNYYIFKGEQAVSFYPVPNYSTSGNQGYIVEGWAAPAQTWPLATSTCPLPDRAHNTVAYGAALLRCIQFAERVSDRKVAMIQAKYKELRGQLEAEMATLTEAQRTADQRRLGVYGGGGYGWY